MIYQHHKTTAQVIDPNRYIYAKWYKGEEVSVRQYHNIVRTYMDHKVRTILEQTCKATNSIAVGAAYLSRRQRDKYKNQRAQIGRNTFYYFNRDQIPLDVLDSIGWADDQLIYEKVV